MAAGSDVRRPGSGRVRHLTQRVCLAALTFAAAASPASAQSGSGIQLTIDGRAPIFVDAASIEGLPQESHTYRDLGPVGASTFTRSGVAVRALLSYAGVDPDHVSLLAVPRSRGGFGYLFHADLANPSDFADGPALVSLDGTSTRFLRPQRGPNDQNAADDIATSSGQPLAISVYTGRLLTLTATHTPAHAVAGQSVHLTATSSCCALAGETLTYSWTPGDNGQPETGSTVDHRFAAAGTYQASVTLTGSHGSVALPVQTTVVVGSPRRAAGHGAGGTGGKKAPASGPATGPSHGGNGDSGTRAGSPVTSRSPTAPSSPAGQPAPARPPAHPRPAPTGQPPPLLPDGSLSTVDGLVVAGPGTLLAGIQSAPVAPAGPQASARAGTSDTAGAGLPLGIVAATGLITAGALRERRRSSERPA